MDMSGAYWAAVLEELPGVAVVFDRFHMMKLMNEKLDELRRAMVREAEGPLKLVIKGTRYLLLTRAANFGGRPIAQAGESAQTQRAALRGLVPQGGIGPALGTGLVCGHEPVPPALV